MANAENTNRGDAARFDAAVARLSSAAGALSAAAGGMQQASVKLSSALLNSVSAPGKVPPPVPNLTGNQPGSPKPPGAIVPPGLAPPNAPATPVVPPGLAPPPAPPAPPVNANPNQPAPKTPRAKPSPMQRMFTALGKVAPRSPFGTLARRAASMKRTARGLKSASGAAKAAGLGRLSSAMGKMSAAAGTGAGVAGGAAGAASGLAAVGAAAFAFTKALGGASDRLVEAHEKLAHASGSMAAVFGEKKVRDVMRDQREGERTAGSARGMVQADADLKDQFARLESSGKIILDTALAPLVKGLAKVVGLLADIAELLTSPFADKEEDTVGITDALKKIADEAEKAKREADARFSRPDVRDFRP